MGENLKKTLLIGSGGHTLSILEMMDEYSSIEGYVDNKEKADMPIRYLGKDDYVLKNYSSEDYNIIIGVVYIDKVNMFLRERIIQKYKFYQGKTLKANTSVITKNSIIGKGTVLFEKSLVNRSVLGKHCVVNTGAIIEHDCNIGDNVFIGPGAIISGGVTIEKNVFIGAGVIIRDDLVISENITIGIGSVVTKNLTAPGIYYGTPVQLKEKYY